MISLFRKIRQKLLSQNRVTRYLAYAVGEIILVVIGILIALQINNWNSHRLERIKEQKILKVLKSEFEYNKLELARNIAKAGSLKNHADSLLLLFNLPRNEVDPARLRYLTSSLGGYSTFDPSNGGLSNLISSGDLNLLKNDSLKIILSKWFGEVQDVKEDETRIMNFGDTHLDPLRLQYLNFKSDSQFQRNSLTLLDLPEFENMVVRMSRGVDYIIENYWILDEEIEKILQLIHQEINE